MSDTIKDMCITIFNISSEMLKIEPTNTYYINMCRYTKCIIDYIEQYSNNQCIK